LQFGFNLESTPDTHDSKYFLKISLSLIIYVICITIVFALKNTCIIGIILIICKVIILISTSLYDVIEFALLLPGGIIALIEKKVK